MRYDLTLLYDFRLLYNKMAPDERQNKFGFLNPASIDASIKSEKFIQIVLQRLKNVTQEYIFIPCNVG